MPRPYYPSAHEVAALVGIPVRRVYRWTQQGLIQPVTAGEYCYDRAAVLKLAVTLALQRVFGPTILPTQIADANHARFALGDHDEMVLLLNNGEHQFRVRVVLAAAFRRKLAEIPVA
jgi:hypothetical protein